MKIIQSEPNSIGAFSPIQTWDSPTFPAGYAIVPDHIDTTTFYEYNGFVTLTIEDDTVTAMDANLSAWETWKASLPPECPPTSVQNREQAYDTDKLISWQGDTLTVTAAAKLWTYYTSEGDTSTAAALTGKIAAAKEEIRGQYPDVSESDTI